MRILRLATLAIVGTLRAAWIALHGGAGAGVFLGAHLLAYGLCVGSGSLAGAGFCLMLGLGLASPGRGLKAIGAFFKLYCSLACLAVVIVVLKLSLSRFIHATLVIVGGMWLDDSVMVHKGLTKFALTLFATILFLGLCSSVFPHQAVVRWGRSRLSGFAEVRTKAHTMLIRSRK
jgi:hypothetical protein